MHAQAAPAAAEGLSAEATGMRVTDGDGGTNAGELALVGADFASPFEDELDTPAFLRRRTTEN